MEKSVEYFYENVKSQYRTKHGQTATAYPNKLINSRISLLHIRHGLALHGMKVGS